VFSRPFPKSAPAQRIQPSKLSLTQSSTYLLWKSISYIDTNGPFSKLGRSHNGSANPKGLEHGIEDGPTTPAAQPGNGHVDQEYIV